MSTNINISVGDNKLLEQARLQQNASRQAQLEKEATQRLSAEATDARTKALAAQGLDANGNPLTGTRTEVPQVERRPAANRIGGLPHVLLIPSAGYQNYGGTLTGFVERARNAKDVRFSRFEPQDPNTYLWGRNLPEGLFVQGGGPNGSNCFETTGNAALTAGVAYAVVNENEYDALYTGTFYREFPLTLWIGNQIVAPTFKYKLADCKSYTIECYIRFGNNTLGAGTEILGDFFSSGDARSTEIYLTFGGLQIQIRLEPTATRVRDSGMGPFEWIIDDKLRIDNFEIRGEGSFNKATLDNLIAAGLTLRQQDFYDYLSINAENGFNANQGLPDTFYPDGFLPNTWHHLAVVRSANSQYSVYLDGVALCSGLTTKDQWNEVEGAAPITGDVMLSIANFGDVPGQLHSAIHGYRFTPKALYSANFTPPPSITSFA